MKNSDLAKQLSDAECDAFLSCIASAAGARRSREVLREVFAKGFDFCDAQHEGPSMKEGAQSAANLMPDVLTQHSLAEALVIYCDTINHSEQLKIDLQFRGALEALDKATQLIIYRINQELVQNIIKHAQASHAVIQLVAHEDKLSIFVEDNGVGFDLQEVNGGYGLQNLRFRVQALQGELSIMSEKGKHTTVCIEFDLNKLKQDIDV